MGAVGEHGGKKGRRVAYSKGQLIGSLWPKKEFWPQENPKYATGSHFTKNPLIADVFAEGACSLPPGTEGQCYFQVSSGEFPPPRIRESPTES